MFEAHADCSEFIPHARSYYFYLKILFVLSKLHVHDHSMVLPERFMCNLVASLVLSKLHLHSVMLTCVSV